MKLSFLLAGLLSLTTTAADASIMPMNLDTLKKQLVAYHDSGAYENDIQAVTLQAQNYLSQRVAENAQRKQPQKLAVVFDIDETSLSNYDTMKQLNFGGTASTIAAAIAKANDAAIAPSLQLYRLVEKDHAAVFFITGRKTTLKDATIKNLNAVGYTQWNGISFKPTNYQQPSVVPYKSSERKKIEAEGYDIIFTIGDQNSDLTGGYADRTFKLPNPYYLIP